MLTRVYTPMYITAAPIDENTERIELHIPTHPDYDNTSFSAEDKKTIHHVLAYANSHKSIRTTDVVVGDRSASCTLHRPLSQKLRARMEIIGRLNFAEPRRTR
jgi:hypothetical protein